MDLLNFLKRNALFVMITAIFSIWMVYLIIMGFSSEKTIHFYNVLTEGDIVDVSDQYYSVLPVARYILEPFIALTFIFGFENDPTRILMIFLTLYFSIRLVLLLIDNSILRRSRKKDVLFSYIKDTLIFFTKYTSLLVLASAIVLIMGLFLVGFIFVANYFETFFHIITFGGLLFLIGRGFYNALIYFRPNLALKIKRIHVKHPVKKVIFRVRRELFYFWTAFLLLFTLNFTFLSINFPAHEIVPINLADDEILMDFHVHTTISDGMLTPEQRVRWYIDHGIDAAVFTDHNTVLGAQRARAYVEANNLEFTVLIGEEFTDDDENIHLNFFGVEESIVPDNYLYEGPYSPNTMNASEAIKYVKAQGGYVIVNHYQSNATAPFTYEQLVGWGVDGFEIGHGQGHYREIRDYCLSNNLTCIGSTDLHLTREINTFVRLKLLDPTNRSLDHIMENLKRNNHSVIIIPEYTYDYRQFRQVAEFNQYLGNMDVFQTLSWLIWSSIGYGFIMFMIWMIKKAKPSHMEQKIIKLQNYK